MHIETPADSFAPSFVKNSDAHIANTAAIWDRLQALIQGQSNVVLDGKSLSIADVVAVAQYTPLKLWLSMDVTDSWRLGTMLPQLCRQMKRFQLQ